MGLFENFPYTNFHELNLDWILSTIKELDSRIDEFVQSNVLTYAEPIQWNITTQYAKNTVVVGPDGTAYMSIAPVPTNILLTNTSYWQPIFNYAETVTVLKKQIASADMEDSTSALVAVPMGGLFWRLNTLYRATKNLNAGDGFVVGTNCVLCTVEEAIKNVIAPTFDIGRSGKNLTDSATETAKRTANNITDSATETAKRTANNIIDTATGDYTETSSHKTVEAEQITEHTTANREIDVDGTNSLHVDSTSTVNIGGDHTETYAKTYGKKVTGVATEEYIAASNTKYTGKHTVTGSRVFINTSDALQYGAVDSDGYVSMIDKNGNPYKLATNSIKQVSTIFISPSDYGAVGDGVTDDTKAIQDAFNATDVTVFKGYGDTEGATYKRVMVQGGKYKITSPIKFPDYGYFDLTGCLFINAITDKSAMFHSEHVHYLTIYGGYYAGNAFNFTSENLDQSRFILSHTIIKGADTGIDFTLQSTSVEIRGNVFDHVIYPIIQRSSDMTVIDDNWFTSPVSSGIGSGNLRILGGESHISNNVFVPIGDASANEVAWIEAKCRTIYITRNRFGGENDGRTAVNIYRKYSKTEPASVIFTNNLCMDTNPNEAIRCVLRMFDFPNTIVAKHNTFGSGCFRLLFYTTLNKTAYSATLSDLLTAYNNVYSYGDMFGYQAFKIFDYDIDIDGMNYQEGDTDHGRSTPLQGANWFWFLVEGYSKFLTKKETFTSFMSYQLGQYVELATELKLPVYASNFCRVYVSINNGTSTGEFTITKNGTFGISGSASGISVGLVADSGTPVYTANTGLSSGRICVKFSTKPSNFIITIVPNINYQEA